MCSHYSIFAPEKLSFPGRKSAYRTLLRKVTLFLPKVSVLWYTDKVLSVLRVSAPIYITEETMENPHSILKKVFGYDSFRPGQEQIVSRLLAGQDVLAVMPTGAGKSICYQVPALLLPGITIVVSPLVSLMKDQVGALVQAGVAAAFLNNSLTDNQKALMLHRAREGWYKIIYVAPERLEMPGFQRFAQERQISMVTVDEAHCISQWGQDFRPSYLRIKEFVDSLPSRPVMGAFTAMQSELIPHAHL